MNSSSFALCIGKGPCCKQLLQSTVLNPSTSGAISSFEQRQTIAGGVTGAGKGLCSSQPQEGARSGSAGCGAGGCSAQERRRFLAHRLGHIQVRGANSSRDQSLSDSSALFYSMRKWPLPNRSLNWCLFLWLNPLQHNLGVLNMHCYQEEDCDCQMMVCLVT